MTMDRTGRLAVALHGIEPATFEHCALIREWLADLGVERVTLCVAGLGQSRWPASSRALDAWLEDRRGRGDAVLVEDTRRPCRAGLEQWVAAALPRPVRIRRPDPLHLDVHPEDFDGHPSRPRAMERALRRAAAERRAVTLDQLGAPRGRLAADLAGVPGGP